MGVLPSTARRLDVLLARDASVSPWTSEEQEAVMEVGRTLGRVVLNARLYDRERHLVGVRTRFQEERDEQDERRTRAPSRAGPAPHGAWTSTSRMLTRRRCHARTVRARLPNETR